MRSLERMWAHLDRKYFSCSDSSYVTYLVVWKQEQDVNSILYLLILLRHSALTFKFLFLSEYCEPILQTREIIYGVLFCFSLHGNMESIVVWIQEVTRDSLLFVKCTVCVLQHVILYFTYKVGIKIRVEVIENIYCINKRFKQKFHHYNKKIPCFRGWRLESCYIKCLTINELLSIKFPRWQVT